MPDGYNERCGSSTTFLVENSNNKVCNLASMSTLAERLNQAMEITGLSQPALAERASKPKRPVSQQNIQHLTSGRNKTSKHLGAIAKALFELGNIRIEWLLNDDGPMIEENETSDDKLPRKGATASDQRAERYMADIEEIDLSAGAGPGTSVDAAERLRTWKVPRNVVNIASESAMDRIKIVRVKGDSMMPTFNPLDRIMVDTGDTLPSPGGIFVVWDGLGFVLKRVQLVPHSEPLRVKITSDNPQFDPYERVIGEAYIQGRVIGKWLWV